ncbi:MAG: hypothetical protein QXX41_12300 [Nitrososphaerota archaeon]
MSRGGRMILRTVSIPLIKEDVGYRLSRCALLLEAGGKAIKGAKAGKAEKEALKPKNEK